MRLQPKLIVMLCNEGQGVPISQLYQSCADLPVQCWGFNSLGLSAEQMIRHVDDMKRDGKTVYIEITSYTREEYDKIAQVACKCNLDYVMGTIYSAELHEKLIANHTRYIPCIGKTPGIPRIILKEMPEIVEEACAIAEKGVDGVSVLAYRHMFLNGDEIIMELKSKLPAGVPLYVVGSVNSFSRIDTLYRLQVGGFSIYTALFNKQFAKGEGFVENVKALSEYANNWEDEKSW